MKLNWIHTFSKEPNLSQPLLLTPNAYDGGGCKNMFHVLSTTIYLLVAASSRTVLHTVACPKIGATSGNNTPSIHGAPICTAPTADALQRETETPQQTAVSVIGGIRGLFTLRPVHPKGRLRD